MEREGRHGMPRVRMEYIRGFLVYVSRTYKYMTQYLKGVHLTLESWRQYREEEVWRMRGEVIKVVVIEGKWEMIENADQPTMVM